MCTSCEQSFERLRGYVERMSAPVSTSELHDITGSAAPTRQDAIGVVQLDNHADLSDLELTALVQRAQRGEERATSVLYQHFAPQLTRMARRQGIDEPDGLASEVLARSFVRLPLLEQAQIETFRAYVFRANRNAIANEHRRRSSRPSTVLIDNHCERRVSASTTSDPETAATSDAWFHDVVGTLTDQQRQVMELRFIDNLTLRETAETLGAEVVAVKSTQRRALRALRNLLVAAGGVAGVVWLIFVGIKSDAAAPNQINTTGVGQVEPRSIEERRGPVDSSEGSPLAPTERLLEDSSSPAAGIDDTQTVIRESASNTSLANSASEVKLETTTFLIQDSAIEITADPIAPSSANLDIAPGQDLDIAPGADLDIAPGQDLDIAPVQDMAVDATAATKAEVTAPDFEVESPPQPTSSSSPGLAPANEVLVTAPESSTMTQGGSTLSVPAQGATQIAAEEGAAQIAAVQVAAAETAAQPAAAETSASIIAAQTAAAETSASIIAAQVAAAETAAQTAAQTAAAETNASIIAAQVAAAETAAQTAAQTAAAETSASIIAAQTAAQTAAAETNAGIIAAQAAARPDWYQTDFWADS